jgi:hypothetical protein
MAYPKLSIVIHCSKYESTVSDDTQSSIEVCLEGASQANDPLPNIKFIDLLVYVMSYGRGLCRDILLRGYP